MLNQTIEALPIGEVIQGSNSNRWGRISPAGSFRFYGDVTSVKDPLLEAVAQLFAIARPAMAKFIASGGDISKIKVDGLFLKLEPTKIQLQLPGIWSADGMKPGVAPLNYEDLLRAGAQNLPFGDSFLEAIIAAIDKNSAFLDSLHEIDREIAEASLRSQELEGKWPGLIEFHDDPEYLYKDPKFHRDNGDPVVVTVANEGLGTAFPSKKKTTFAHDEPYVDVIQPAAAEAAVFAGKWSSHTPPKSNVPVHRVAVVQALELAISL